MAEDQRGGSATPARTISTVVGVILVGLIVLFAFSDRATDDSTNRLLGQRVPAIAGETLNGGPYDVDEARGRWVLINFFATWCGPCIAEHPELVELESWGADTGQIELVSVVFDDDPQNVADLFDRLGGSWPVMESPETVVAFQLRRVPESFLVSPDGQVVAHFISGIEAAQVREVVENS